MMDRYLSRFDGGARNGTVRICPIPACQYAFPAELEDVARVRHRHTHTEDEWREVRGRMRGARDGEEARHREWVTGWDTDWEELRGWLPAALLYEEI